MAYTRDIVVTGMPCSGTTVSAKILAQIPDTIVDHIVFPHSVGNDGRPSFKPLPEAKLYVWIRRREAIHKMSLVKNNFAGDLDDAAELQKIGFARLQYHLDHSSGLVYQFDYSTVWRSPDVMMRAVAAGLGLGTPPANTVATYNGDLKYTS